MSDELRRSYDETPYQSFSFPQSHPDRLATIGWLLGMEPASVDRCRVLEVGCGSGGNLIPMAATLPDSDFVGIDFSPVQIERGRADVAALGLANIRLLPIDILEFSEEHGTFDYIIAHGVYSWVPEAVRERLFDICGRQLAPAGIAFVSFNVLPGWRMRSVIREALTYHTREIADPIARIAQARAVLDFLAGSVKSAGSAYGSTLRTEADNLRKKRDDYVLHEYLEAVNEPEYFRQFMERAAPHGLAYLGDAEFVLMQTYDLGPQVAPALDRIAPDLLRREQLVDFLRERAFRETLLVREGVALTRQIPATRLMSLRVASNAQPRRDNLDVGSNAVEEFRIANGSRLTTPTRITKAAMLVLAAAWPLALPFDELYARSRALLPASNAPPGDERVALASEILPGYGAGVVELHSTPSPFVTDVSERPVGSPVARFQLQRGLQAASLRHVHGTFSEETCRLFLLLDGTRTRREIAATFWPGVPEATSMSELDAALAHLARMALLVR